MNIRMIKRSDTWCDRLGALGILLMLTVFYSLLTDVAGALDPMLFPGWKVIVPAFIKSIGALFTGFYYSMRLLLPAFVSAVITGIGIGLFVGMRPRLKRLLMPLFRALNPIPPTMLIPYAIAVLPTFWLSSAAIIFIGVFWPVLMSTLHGIYLLEPRWLDNAACLELRGWKLIRKVILPGAMPQIFAGIGSGLIFSFILLTVAEMFGAKAGMGFFVQYYADFAEYDRVLAGIIFLSLVVMIIMALYDLIQRKVLFWTVKR